MNSKEEYINLCKKEKNICIYNQPWWLDAVCGESEWNVLLYKKNGEIFGALPYFQKIKLGMKYVTQPLFTQNQEIWMKDLNINTEYKRISYEHEVFTALINEIENKSLAYYKQCLNPSITNWLPYYWKGYKQTTRYTYRINNIRDSEILFNSFRSNKRGSIKKAKSYGYEVKFDLPAKDFYLHHKKSLEKQGKKISYTYDLFKKIFDAAYFNNSGRSIYASDVNGEVVCAFFNVWDNNWGYDLISAIDPSTKNTGISDLLLYTMMEYLSDKVTGYDFEGSMIEGVEQSYRNFGTIQTPYFEISKVISKNPIVRIMIGRKERNR